MIFTLFPISSRDLHTFTDTRAFLSPKTTGMNSKIVFGLIVNKINADDLTPTEDGVMDL